MQIYRVELGDKEKYELIKFPGGELHVRVHEKHMPDIVTADVVAVTARITCSDQLIETLLLCDALRQDSDRAISLILPYLPYGRADRRFSDGDCFGVATFARLINSANVTPITLDAHSAQGLQHFARIKDLPSNHFIQQAFDDFSKYNNGGKETESGGKRTESCDEGPDSGNEGTHPLTLLFPDKGARQRYEAVSSKYENVLHCSKERNLLTGKLKGFKVPELSEFKTKKVLLVDDICDGGGTFNGIADSLKEYGLELALYVTHGIFSKGFSEISNRFKRIYTTDSFARIRASDSPGMEKLTVYPTQDFFLQSLSKLQEFSTAS
ncbi:MAG: ribose-phosphate pyrophosphokinase-like domain-containing protein [Candidatus Obscuribacterales bacterium]